MEDAGTPLIVRARVEAYGRVQGVFYRATVARAAADRGICGSCVNREDGSVEAVFEGPLEDVRVLIEVSREGSSSTHVDRFEIAWEDPEGLSGFTTG